MTNALPLLDFHNLRVMRGQKVALDDFTLRIGARRARRHSRSQRLRQVDSDQDHYPRMLSRGAGRFVDETPRPRSWDVFKLREHMGIVSNDLMLSLHR